MSYLEDWSNGYQNSPEYVYGLMDNLKQVGISHFMLPDTLGVLSPDEVFNSLSDMCQRYPTLAFDFHPHNDYGLATANVMAAVRAGVSSIHCTVNCLGERAGNASLAEVAVVLRDKMNMQLAIDESHIVRISKWLKTSPVKGLQPMRRSLVRMCSPKPLAFMPMATKKVACTKPSWGRNVSPASAVMPWVK